ERLPTHDTDGAGNGFCGAGGMVCRTRSGSGVPARGRGLAHRPGARTRGPHQPLPAHPDPEGPRRGPAKSGPAGGRGGNGPLHLRRGAAAGDRRARHVCLAPPRPHGAGRPGTFRPGAGTAQSPVGRMPGRAGRVARRRRGPVQNHHDRERPGQAGRVRVPVLPGPPRRTPPGADGPHQSRTGSRRL
ncbi:MAG: hypothetical protein AVDCRST_MAG56-4435, partial [uncultured Cytophagales bacterium]